MTPEIPGNIPRRAITQEELDGAYAALQTLNAELFSQSQRAEGAQVESGANWTSTSPHMGSGDSVGVHLGHDRTQIIFLSRKGKPEGCFALNVGLDASDQLLEELTKALEPVRKKRVSVFFTATGPRAAMILAPLPKMNRATMLKALKVQLKTQTGEDKEDIHYTNVAGKKPGEGNQMYLAMAIDKAITEKVGKHLRRAKIRATAWDADLLCFARAAGHLWHEGGLADTTRFLIVLDWDHCRLIIVSPDGKIISPRLSVGVQSFLQHLLTTREKYVPKSTDEKDWRVLPSDTIEVSQRKILALQAIHDVYRPLAQQIKTQLYAACNEHGVPLPSHFAVVAPGTNLFHLEESFSEDLGIRAVRSDDFPLESMGALGAALWDRGEARLNVLPKSRGEMLKGVRETLKGIGSKLPMGIEGLNLPEYGAALILVPAALLIGMLLFPVWQRWRVNSRLDTLRTTLVTLDVEKKRIAESRSREEMYERKFQLSKQIELRRFAMSHGLKELFSLIPPVIHLQALIFRGDTLTVRGISTNPTALQTFLRESLELRHLADPTAVSVKRVKNDTQFELTFRFRS